MALSEEGKVRLMVIPIVAMLAVTMVVAGYYQEEEESKQPEFEVQKGDNETEISYLQEDESSVDYNRSIKANTSIDGQPVLEFEAVITGSAIAADYHWTTLNLTAEADIPEDLNPEKFRFRASGSGEDNLSDSEIEFLSMNSEINNGSVLDDSEFLPFEECYSLDSNQFRASSSVIWRISEGSRGEPFTLNLEAIIEGLSAEVSASIEVHIEGE